MISPEFTPRHPPWPGMGRFELLHQDAQGNVLGYTCDEGPGIRQRPGFGRRVDMPPIPFLGPLGGILITIPTVGHGGFADDISSLTGYTLEIGTSTAAELSSDTGCVAPITTYGGAAASVTPTVLGNVITWMHKWTFTTGAAFTVTEMALKRNGVVRLRHKYSSSKYCVSTQHLTGTFTNTM